MSLWSLWQGSLASCDPFSSSSRSFLSLILPSSLCNHQFAIKRFKETIAWDMVAYLRELQYFVRVPYHTHVVRLDEVIRHDDSTLSFVFEYMPDGSLHDHLTHRTRNRLGPMSPEHLRSWTRQLLEGIAHLHAHQCMHRDIKPENILVSGNTIKIADFSLARFTVIEQADPLTTYVSTRWYRAPEILLQACDYNAAVDCFAIGLIIAEMRRQSPLFAGDNEIDQLDRIFGVLGTPAQANWPSGVECLERLGLAIPAVSTSNAGNGQALRLALSTSSHDIATPEVVDLCGRLLQLNPDRRYTAKQALAHPFTRDDEGEQGTVPIRTVTAASTTPPTYKESTDSSSAMVTASPVKMDARIYGRGNEIRPR